MRVYPDGYLDKITEFGRQIESEITYTVDEETNTLTVEDINKIQVIYNAEFFRTIMTRVDIETKVYIPKNTVINIKFGVRIGEEYPKVDFGSYKIIEEPVYNADSRSYTFMAYDEMVDSMVNYDEYPVDIEFPATHKQFIDAICSRLGWIFNEAIYTNADTEIEKDIYVGTDMTIRGVLDDLCTATMGNFIVKDKELILKYPVETGLTLGDKYLKDIKVEFGKHYGPVNSLVLSRSAESDNIYNQDEVSIEENGLNEVKIIDNMLLSSESRNDWIQAMFNKIKGFEFDLFDITTTGIGIFEPLDQLTISHDNKEYSVIVMNNEFTITQGLEETMFTEEPEFSETDYKYADTEDRVFRKAQIIVDKQNLEITSLVEKTDELESQVSEVTQTTEGLTATVTENITDLQEKIAKLGLTQEELELIFKLQNGNNLIRNSVMRNGTSFWYKELYDVFASSVKPENPYDGQYWFNEEDSEEYKRNQLYQWNKAENRWIESTKSKYDLMNTGVEGFTQFEHQESRENSISNSIILMDAGNNILEKTHLFGITEGISIPTDTEMISLGLKVKNQIRTGNIYVAFGFAPVEPRRYGV